MMAILVSLITVNVLQRTQESPLALSINTESYGTRNALKRMVANAVAMTTINLRKEILTVIVLFDYINYILYRLYDKLGLSLDRFACQTSPTVRWMESQDCEYCTRVLRR